MNRAETINKAKENWERRPADFYGTPPEVTSALLDWMFAAEVFPFKRPVWIHEPCCGEGHISKVLETVASFEVVSHDLHDRGYGKGGLDYLKMPEFNPKHYDYDVVITNPPFSLAEQFIRRAMRDAPVIAMFLPNDYWHAKSRAKLFRTRPPRAVLALTWRPVFVEERGTSPLANYSWTVWQQGWSQRTEYVLLDKPVC